MAVHYSNLEELKRKKELLKQEVRDLEDLLTFKDPSASLGVMTGGRTDGFVKNKITEDGSTSLSLDTGNIIREVGEKIKDSVTQHSILHFATSDTGVAVIDDLLKAGAVAMVGKVARKNIAQKSWKNKALGLALIYLAPVAFKLMKEKLEDYQRHKTTSSLEQLI